MRIPRPLIPLVAGVVGLALIGAAPPGNRDPGGPPDHAGVPDHAKLPFGDDTDRTVEPTGVIALVDTGINPYHVAFRDGSDRVTALTETPQLCSSKFPT